MSVLSMSIPVAPFPFNNNERREQMLSCPNSLDQFPAREIASWLISTFKAHQHESDERAILKAAAYLDAHPNTIKAWRDGNSVPSGKYLWKMRAFDGFLEFFGGVE